MWASCFADARCRPRLDRTGTKLHHSFGMWPLLIDDTTEAIEIEPGQRLVLEARGWPVGKARVEITVNAAANGSLVSIAEDVIDGPTQLVPRPVRVAAIDVRNRETLRRLAYLAEGRADNSATS